MALIWATLQFLYIVVLQASAFVLALATRKVEIKVLNDYKEMSIIVYSTTGILLALALVTWTAGSYFIVSQVLAAGMLMVATTIFLFFVFVPKVTLFLFQYRS